jgi:hypothetical protein
MRDCSRVQSAERKEQSAEGKAHGEKRIALGDKNSD